MTSLSEFFMSRRAKVARRVSVLGQAYERGNEENYGLVTVTHVDVKGFHNRWSFIFHYIPLVYNSV